MSVQPETIKIGKRGAITIPVAIRQQYGFSEGTRILVQPTEQGVVLQQVTALPVEAYTPERKAEFLLNNAVTHEDYDEAIEQVRGMGLDPESIPHHRLTA